MEYGNKMKDIRDLYQVTQKEVANVLNIAKSTYNQYEQQYDIIPIKHLNNFCNHFKISIDYVFDLTLQKRYIDEIDEISTKVSGERIKALRKEFRLTQKGLANKLNIANSMISEYENGHYTISTASLYSLSKNFNISSDYLLGKTNKVKYLDKEKAKELIKI